MDPETGKLLNDVFEGKKEDNKTFDSDWKTPKLPRHRPKDDLKRMTQMRKEEKEDKFGENKRRYWTWVKMRRDSQRKNNLYTKYDIFLPLAEKKIKPKQDLNSKINRYNIYKLDINIKVFFQYMQALV